VPRRSRLRGTVELLYEIARLTKTLGRELTEADMNDYGAVDAVVYEERWGSFAKAKEEAHQAFGSPLVVTVQRQKSEWN
jgi:Homing endonuclease associated repeat